MKNCSTIKHLNTGNTFWKKGGNVRISTFSLDTASGVLKKRFPYLNLKGLKKIEGLKITPRPLNRWIADPGRNSLFYIDSKMNELRAGRIAFRDDLSTNVLACSALFPDLPPSVKGAGATIFTLIVLRANSLANKKVAITALNDRSTKMAKKMRAFSPKFVNLNWIPQTDAILKVPKLSSREAKAVEWYWKYVLKVE